MSHANQFPEDATSCKICQEIKSPSSDLLVNTTRTKTSRKHIATNRLKVIHLVCVTSEKPFIHAIRMTQHQPY